MFISLGLVVRTTLSWYLDLRNTCRTQEGSRDAIAYRSAVTCNSNFDTRRLAYTGSVLYLFYSLFHSGSVVYEGTGGAVRTWDRSVGEAAGQDKIPKGFKLTLLCDVETTPGGSAKSGSDRTAWTKTRADTGADEDPSTQRKQTCVPPSAQARWRGCRCRQTREMMSHRLEPRHRHSVAPHHAGQRNDQRPRRGRRRASSRQPFTAIENAVSSRGCAP